MKTKDAIKNAGSAAQLAKILGITHGAICQWGDLVPDARVWQLKALNPGWFAQPRKQRTQAQGVA